MQDKDNSVLLFFEVEVQIDSLACTSSLSEVWQIKNSCHLVVKFKKVGKTTRPFGYDLNQIPCDYTVEVRNRFKGLDLIESLMNYGQRFVTLYRRQG